MKAVIYHDGWKEKDALEKAERINKNYKDRLAKVSGRIEGKGGWRGKVASKIIKGEVKDMLETQLIVMDITPLKILEYTPSDIVVEIHDRFFDKEIIGTAGRIFQKFGVLTKDAILKELIKELGATGGHFLNIDREVKEEVKEDGQ